MDTKAMRKHFKTDTKDLWVLVTLYATREVELSIWIFSLK